MVKLTTGPYFIKIIILYKDNNSSNITYGQYDHRLYMFQNDKVMSSIFYKSNCLKEENIKKKLHE